MPRALRPANARPRKDEILDEATRLFAERGYEGTSMADLAQSVGIRKASLFYHFASKDVLYEAVLDRLLGTVASAIKGAMKDEGSYVERLDEISNAVTRALGEHPFAARLLLREAMDWGPVARDKMIEPVLAVMGAAEDFVRRGQEAGDFAEGDAKQMVVTGIGAHIIPFGIDRVIERYLGTSPYAPAHVAARRETVREHVRGMVLARRPKKRQKE